jgi:hypothetical protein
MMSFPWPVDEPILNDASSVAFLSPANSPQAALRYSRKDPEKNFPDLNIVNIGNG